MQRTIGLIIGALLLTGCGEEPSDSRSPASEGADVLAIVGSRKLTQDMFRAEMARRLPNATAQGQEIDSRRALLEQIVEEWILAEQARAAGFHQTPEFLRTQERLLISRFREQELNPQLAAIEVSDAEIEAEYNKRVAAYTAPALWRAALIHIALPSGASEPKKAEAKSHAAAVLQQAQQLPADETALGSLAAEYSHHRPSRYRGGDIGYIPEDADNTAWPQPVLDALAALRQPGDLAPLVEAADGFYILKLIEKRPSRTRPLEQIAPNLRANLLKTKRDQAQAAWLAGLRQKTPIEINAQALHSVEPPPPAVAPNPPRPPSLPQG